MPALPEALPGHAARVHVGSLVSAAVPWGLWRVFWTWPAGAPVGGGEGTATCPGASGRQVAGALILPQLCRAAVTPSGSTRGRGRRAWGTGSDKLRLEGGTQVLQQGQGSGVWCRACSVWKEACGSCDGVGHGASPPSHFRLRAGTHSQAPYVFLVFFFFTLDKHFNKSWETFSLLHHHSERLLSRFWARGGPTRGRSLGGCAPAGYRSCGVRTHSPCRRLWAHAPRGAWPTPLCPPHVAISSLPGPFPWGISQKWDSWAPRGMGVTSGFSEVECVLPAGSRRGVTMCLVLYPSATLARMARAACTSPWSRPSS